MSTRVLSCAIKGGAENSSNTVKRKSGSADGPTDKKKVCYKIQKIH